MHFNKLLCSTLLEPRIILLYNASWSSLFCYNTRCIDRCICWLLPLVAMRSNSAVKVVLLSRVPWSMTKSWENGGKNEECWKWREDYVAKIQHTGGEMAGRWRGGEASGSCEFWVLTSTRWRPSAAIRHPPISANATVGRWRAMAIPRASKNKK